MAENAPSAAAEPGAQVIFMAGTEDHEEREPPPADREARALRGPPWFSFCLRVKSFLCRRPARLCPAYPGAPARPSQDMRARHVSPTDTARQDQPNETTMKLVACPDHQRPRLRRPHTACVSSIKPRLIFHQPTAGHLPPPQPSRRQSASTGVPRGLSLTPRPPRGNTNGARPESNPHKRLTRRIKIPCVAARDIRDTPWPRPRGAGDAPAEGARTTTHRKPASRLPSPRPAPPATAPHPR